MVSPPSPSGSSAYFESLMRAGQQSMKQFDDALASAMGVGGKPATPEDLSPFAVAANLQRQYWSQIMGFWKGILVNPSAAGAEPSRRDRRFQDETWQHSPYYDLIKQSYLGLQSNWPNLSIRPRWTKNQSCSFASTPVGLSTR